MSDYGDARTPVKSSDFSITSTRSSVKKALFASTAYEKGQQASQAQNAISYANADNNLMQSKIDHLEKERIDLTMQLHRRDEKDRERKLKLEQLEFRLTSSEEERSRAVQESIESREMFVRMKCESDELKAEVTRLTNEIQSTNRLEAMDVWKKMSTASRALKKAEEDLAQCMNEKLQLFKDCTRLTTEVEDLEDEKKQYLAAIDSFQARVTELEHENLQIPQLKSFNSNLQSQIETLKSNHTKDITNLEQQNEELKHKNEELSLEVQMLMSRTNIAAVTADLPADEVESIQSLRKQLYESEVRRRQLHNQVQDLKGNIRVYLRCRPFLNGDGADTTTPIVTHPDRQGITLLNKQGSSHQFYGFEQVFSSEADQQQVYNEVGGLVQSALDGFRVCVFCYGQTGSGKTHTMSGSGEGNARGIIPRAVEDLLSQACTMQGQGWTITITTSVVEIYNEEIRDLLAADNLAKTNAKAGKITIVKQQGRVMIHGLEQRPLDLYTSDQPTIAMQQFHQSLAQATSNRRTARTAMNEDSSRSHLVVILDLTATSTTSQGTVTLHGGLRLCDLAGSERLNRTDTLNDAARLKETVNINSSLSCLADVFLALSQKAAHIPFRNSKLTMLLQDCLSGEGKALMFVNVSPTMASAPETLCSLRFASQVSQVELGKAQKHMVSTVAVPSSAPVPPPVATSSRSSRSSMLIAPPTAAAMMSTNAASFQASSASVYGNAHSAMNSVAQQDVSMDNIMPPPIAPSTKERGVRFQLDPSPVQPPSEESSTTASMRPFSGTSGVTDEGLGKAANKPLAVHSFLASSQPERGVPKVRSLGSSRRQSVVPPPSALLSSMPPQQPYSALLGNTKTRSMLLSGGQPFATNNADVKENDNMNSGPMAFSVAAVISKRDSSCMQQQPYQPGAFDNYNSTMPAKRVKTVDGSSSSAMGLGGSHRVVDVWPMSNGTGGGGNTNSRKSTWR